MIFVDSSFYLCPSPSYAHNPGTACLYSTHLLPSAPPATFGSLELYGIPHSIQWTSLASTAAAGSSAPLRLAAPVDWPPGAEVVVTTSSFEARETEVRRVTAVSEDGLQVTLNDTLRYQHLGTLAVWVLFLLW